MASTDDSDENFGLLDVNDIEWLRVFRQAIDDAYDSVLITDAELDAPGPRILYANPAFQRMTQYHPAEVIGYSPRFLHGPQTEREKLDAIRASLERGEALEARIVNYRKDGSSFMVEWRITPVYYEGAIRYYIAIQRDVTERERMIRILREYAEIDELTGVYNRRGAREIVQLELERCQRYDTSASVAILDIDHFKDVNDDYGHSAGDAILSEVANLLRSRLRANDSVARWGGEEFLLILPHTTGYCAGEASEGVRQAIERATFTNGIHTTVSLGIAAYSPSESLDGLIERADAALYEAKAAGRNCCRGS